MIWSNAGDGKFKKLCLIIFSHDLILNTFTVVGIMYKILFL